MDGGAWWAAVHGVAKTRTQLSDFTFTFHFHALEKEMATPSSVLAWRIPGTRKPGGLHYMGSHRVRYDRSKLAVAVPNKQVFWWLKSRWNLLVENLLLIDLNWEYRKCAGGKQKLFGCLNVNIRQWPTGHSVAPLVHNLSINLTLINTYCALPIEQLK